MLLYSTTETSLHGKQNYKHNEYHLENGKVVMYKCHRQKVFFGDENEWVNSKHVVCSWEIDDPNMPNWLLKHLP